MGAEGGLYWTIAQGGALVVVLFSFIWDWVKERPANRTERERMMSAVGDAITKLTAALDLVVDKLSAAHNAQIVAILNSHKEQHDKTLEKTESLVAKLVAMHEDETKEQRAWIIQEFRLNQSGLKDVAVAIQNLSTQLSEVRINRPIRGGPKHNEGGS